MIRAAWLLMALCLAACSVSPQTAPQDPLVYDTALAARAKSAVIAVPGALTSVEVMSPLDGFAAPGRFVAYYRLPGLDGLPEDQRLDIMHAADRIAALAETYDLQRVYLVGFSTGAAISLEAAKRIRTARPQTQVAVAGISTALPSPQPLLAGWRGVRGNVAAAARAGSLDRRTIWLEYYKTLLYGPQPSQDAATRQTAADVAATNAPRIEVPSPRIAASHGLALTGWTNPDPQRLTGSAIAFFHGSADPVFPLRALDRFAARLPDKPLRIAYDGQGHLLMLTQPTLWFDIAQFFGLNPRVRP